MQIDGYEGGKEIDHATSGYWAAIASTRSSASRFSLLQGGAVDIAQFLQPRELEALKKQQNVAVDAVNSSYMIWLELNSKIATFDINAKDFIELAMVLGC